MAMAFNIVITLILINTMLFFAYPSYFADNTDMIKGLSNFGYTVETNSTSGEINITTNSGNTSNITETMFGIGGTTGNQWVDAITGVIDYIGGAINTILWIGSFMFAGASIAWAMPSMPLFIKVFITLIYGVGWIFAIFEIITGR